MANNTDQKDLSSQKNENIFKELSADLDFWEIKEELKKEKRDKEYYLKVAVTVFSVCNIFLFFVLVSVFWYVKIQNNPEMYSKSYLDPICGFILPKSVENTHSSCSSISALLRDYQEKKQTLSSDIAQKVIANIGPFYSFENFLFSKEVSFLLNAKNTKLPIMSILSDFDTMKNEFTWVDKKIIDCKGFQITSENILTANCTAYSSFWTGSNDVTRLIIWETWKRDSSVQWTSMTIAASFLNFIEKNPHFKFRILEKQNVFSTENIIWEWDFVKQTRFNLKLQYSDFENNLSF